VPGLVILKEIPQMVGVIKIILEQVVKILQVRKNVWILFIVGGNIMIGVMFR